MSDRLHRIRALQVAFRHISLKLTVVDEHMVPWLVLGWTTKRHFFIPLGTSFKLEVDIDDYPPIIKQAMVNNLTDRKFSVLHTVSNEEPGFLFHEVIISAITLHI